MTLDGIITLGLGIPAFTLAITSQITWLYLKFTIGIKFEKLFSHIHNNQTANVYGDKTGRLLCYIGLINDYDYHKKYNTPEYQTFNGYNFPTHVTKLQKIIAKVYIRSGTISILLAIIWAIYMLIVHHSLKS